MVISKNLQPAYVSRFLEHSHRNGEPSHPSKTPAHLSVSRQMRQPNGDRVVGAFDEFAVFELRAGSHERDQVWRVYGAPA